MTDADLIVIYDGECAVCSTVSGVLSSRSDITLVSWHHPDVQEFLQAQFSSPPFSLLVVDRTEAMIYIGESATELLAERIDLPRPTRMLLGNQYERIASTTQRFTGSGRRLSSRHGSEPLTDSAWSLVDDLVSAVDR